MTTPTRALIAAALAFIAPHAAAQGCSNQTDVASTLGAVENHTFGGFAPHTLDTTLAQGASFADGAVCYFTVTTTATIYVQAIALQTSNAPLTTMRADVYRTAAGDTHDGNELAPTAWQAASYAVGASAGLGASSRLDLLRPMRLTPGSYGVAVHAHDFDLELGNATPASFTDGTVTIDGGAATTAPFTSPVQMLQPSCSIVYKIDGEQGVNTRVQFLVPAYKLASIPGPISDIEFAANQSGRQYSRSLQIRMRNAPTGFVLGTDLDANIAGATTVLARQDHVWTFQNGPWDPVGFDASFQYDGASDVVVEVLARGNIVHADPASVAGFRRSDAALQCARADTWTGAIPSLATAIDTAGLRMRLMRACAAEGSFGAACGTLRSLHSGFGAIGTDSAFSIFDGLGDTFAFAVFGFLPITPAPVSLNGLGWTNCSAYLVPAVIEAALTSPAGIATHVVPIPDDTNLVGASLYCQWLQIDPSLVHGVQLSNYARLVVGSM